MTRKKISKIGVLYLMANIFEKAIAFFVLPVFTNLLPTGDYGIASTYISYQNILGVFICLSLGNSLRGAIVDYKESMNEYSFSVLLFETLIAIIVSGIIIVIGINVIPTQYKLLVIICPIHAFFNSVISMLILRYMLELKYIQRTLLSILPSFISIFVSIYLIKHMQSNLYLGRILGIFIVVFVFGVTCYLIIVIRGRFTVNYNYFKYAISFSAPLVFHGLSLIILNQMDRVMITHLRNFEENGIYSVAYNFGTIAIAFTSAINDIWIPWFYENMKSDEKQVSINRYATWYIWCCALLSCGVILLSPEVMRIFTNNNYWPGIEVVPILVVGNYFAAICGLPINAMYYSKKTKMIAVSSIIAMMVNLLLNIMLIKKYGAFGASIATVFSYIVIFVLQNTTVLRTYKGLFMWKIYIPQTIVVFAVMTFSYFNTSNYFTRWGISLALSGLFIYFAVKEWNIKIPWKITFLRNQHQTKSETNISEGNR